MDNRILCVYNLARGVSLSSKVTVADGANQPLTILKVLVGGLAMDSKSGLWISPIHGMPSVPRLFPFDLLYLDDGLRVLDTTEFIPGMEFPLYHREVVSALVLPSGSLQSTQTEHGDHLVICPAAEMERRIAVFGTEPSFGRPTVSSRDERPGHFASLQVETLPTNALASPLAAPSAALAVAEEVMALDSVLAAAHSNNVVALATQPETTVKPEIDLDISRRQTEIPGAPAAIEDEPVTVIAENAANEPVEIVEDGRVTPSLGVPLLSITEVVLERPRAVEPSLVVGFQGEVEDLFANWMEAPTLASTWKAGLAEPVWQQNKQSSASQVTDTPSSEQVTVDASADRARDQASPVPEGISVEPLMAKAEGEPQSRPQLEPTVVTASPEPVEIQIASTQEDSGAVKIEAAGPPDVSKSEREVPKAKTQPVVSSAASTPIRVALPQPQQSTTSTVGQYGLWRASLPTAAIPLAVGKEPSKPSAAKAQEATTSKKAKSTPVERATDIEAPKAKSNLGEANEAVPVSTSARFESKATVEVKTPPKSRDYAALRAEDRKKGIGKVMEAVSRVPIVPDNMLGAIERRKPINKAPILPLAEKKALPEQVKLAQELPSPPAEQELPSAAVDSVQRKLGIGHANNPEAAASMPAEIVHATPVKNVAAAEAIDQEAIPEMNRVAMNESPGNLSLTFAQPETTTPNGKPKASLNHATGNRKEAAQPRTFAERFKRWLNPVATTNSDRRRAHRRYVPGMVAHYYTGGPPKAHDIADISMTGFYLLTEDRWMPDTMIQMTLQKPCAKGERKQSITVLSRIVRRGSDGVAAQFVMPESLDPYSHEVQPSQTTDRLALARFI